MNTEPTAKAPVPLASRTPAEDALNALLFGPLPKDTTEFRRSIMLATLIGREIESGFATTQPSHEIPQSKTYGNTKLCDNCRQLPGRCICLPCHICGGTMATGHAGFCSAIGFNTTPASSPEHFANTLFEQEGRNLG